MINNRLISISLILAATLSYSHIKVYGQALVTSFSQTGVSGGGELYNAAINPYDTNNLYVSCDMSGLYRSSDNGASWKMYPSTTFMAGARSQVQITSTYNSVIQYALRRTSFSSTEQLPYRSADQGLTWTPITLPVGAGNVMGAVWADPTGGGGSTQRIVLEDYQKLWYSSNGGASYSSIYSTQSSGGVRTAGCFWDGNRIIIASTMGLHVSNDNGLNWNLEVNHPNVPSNSKIVEFAGAKDSGTGETCLYAIFIEENLNAWNHGWEFDDTRFRGAFRMDYINSSTPWTLLTFPANTPPARKVDVSISDPATPWIAAGRDSTSQILLGTNKGLNWTNTLKVSQSGFAPNQNVSTGWQGNGGMLDNWANVVASIDVCNYDSGRVLITNSQIYLTTDYGNTWNQKYVTSSTQNPANSSIVLSKNYVQTGLNVTTGHWVYWKDVNTQLIGSSDIGCQFTSTSGISWKFDRNVRYPGGDMRWANWNCFVKKTNSNRLYAAVSALNDIYEPQRLDDEVLDGSREWLENKEGDVLYSDNDGLTWNSLSGAGKGLASTGNKFPGPVVWLAVDPSPTRANYIYASVVDRTNGGIYRSTNGGGTWTKLANPPRTEGHPNFIGFRATQQMIVTYAGRRDISGNFTSSSGVFYSSDGGNTWADRTATAMNVFTREVAWNPASSGTWWASVQGAETLTPSNGGIYRTTNSGTAWTKIWTKSGVQSCTYLSGTTPRLYVTTMDDGLWVSSNPSAAIPTFTKVTAFPFARAKRVFAEGFTATPGAIWVTTQGGGVYRGKP